MARDAESLKIRPWAEDGDRLDPERRVPPIDRDRGWTYDFSAIEGETLSRDVFNQLMREVTGMLHELNRGGSIPEFDPFQPNRIPARRGDIYRYLENGKWYLIVCFRDESERSARSGRNRLNLFWRVY